MNYGQVVRTSKGSRTLAKGRSADSISAMLATPPLNYTERGDMGRVTKGCVHERL